MARQKIETAAVVPLSSSTTAKAVLTKSGAHLLRGREPSYFLTERELDRLAEQWLAFRRGELSENGRGAVSDSERPYRAERL